MDIDFTASSPISGDQLHLLGKNRVRLADLQGNVARSAAKPQPNYQIEVPAQGDSSKLLPGPPRRDDFPSASTRSGVRRLLVDRVRQKRREVLFEFYPRGFVNVQHVARFIVRKAQIGSNGRR